jgi:hypothetical protein
MIDKRIHKVKWVMDAQWDGQWIRDIVGSLLMIMLSQYVMLWSHLQDTQVHPNVLDKFIKKWSTNQ